MAQQGQYPINPFHPTLQSYAQPQYPPPTLQHPQPLTLPYGQQYEQYAYEQYAYEPLPQLHQPLHFNQYALPATQPLYPQAQVYQPHTDRVTAKRPREALHSDAVGVDAADFPSPKRKKAQDVLFRIVVPSRQIGKVIGKGGCRIQKIREQTKATIKIADAIARGEERVIIISSKENDGGVTDAEMALHQTADLILKDDEALSSLARVASSVSSATSTATLGSIDAVTGISEPHVAANAIKFLIAGTQAGGLIGTSGQNIEKLRNSSGATITVLAPNQLPFCASAHESDRLVQISGEVPAVLKAVDEIGVQLRENPPKQIISISPTYNFSTTRTAQQYLDPTAAEYVTMDMVISETMVGGLIGRCGSNISRIRSESGATIRVFGGKGEQKHRQIQLGGTAQQVALAKHRVDEYIYSQLIQQPDSEQVSR